MRTSASHRRENRHVKRKTKNPSKVAYTASGSGYLNSQFNLSRFVIPISVYPND